MRVAILYDVPGWAYHRRAKALERYAPPDIHVDAGPWPELPAGKLDGADVVLLLDYAALDQVKPKLPAGCKLVCSFSADSRRRQDWWPRIADSCDWVISVSGDRYRNRGPVENCCHISNGIDLDNFWVSNPMERRPEVALWLGRANSSVKGHRLLAEVLNRVSPLGFDAEAFAVRNDPARGLGSDYLRAWYNSGAYFLCTSESEGSANCVGEAVACGCVAVSAPVGDVMEWGEHGVNCIVCQPDEGSFADGLLLARKNRLALAAEAEKVIAAWGWDRRAEYYWALVRRLVAGKEIKPFSFRDFPAADLA